MSDNNERELLKQRRRALIKAAGAVPVVYSLANGSPVAAASLTCDQKPIGTTAPANISTTATGDTWLRKKVDKYTIKIKDGSFVTAIQQNGNYYAVLGSNASGTPLDVTEFKKDPKKSGDLYLLVDYDGASSSPLRVYKAGSADVNPISQSCWNSLNPSGRGKQVF